MIDEKKIEKLMRKKGLTLPRGDVYIIKERCKGCGLCIEYCPKGVLIESEQINEKGYHIPMLVEEPPLKICVNCEYCMYICPEFAIFTKEYKEKKK